MTALFKNNAYSTLASGVTDVALTLSVASGEGARFPSPTGADYFYATLIDTSNNLEIIKVTARSTDTFTIVREQESTSARAYSTSDRIELRITVAGLDDISSVLGDTTPQLGGFLDTNDKFISHSQGANIASVAGDTNIWANFDGNTVHITGTNAITDFGTPKQAGDSIWVVFDGAASVVDSATITVAGNTNYQAATNDLALVYALSTSTFLFTPFPNSGASPVASGGGATAAEATNIMINSFNIAAAGGFAYQNMVDGVVDGFEDATGIDASGSTNELRETDGNWYWGGGAGYSADRIPTMTSNTLPSGVADATTPSNLAAWNVFDDVALGINEPYNSNTLPAFVSYEFTSTKIITRYTIRMAGQTAEANRDPVNWTFDGWDGSSWVTKDTQTSETFSLQGTNTYSFSNTTAYIKYRINVTASGGAAYIHIDEMEFKEGGLVTNMTLVSNATTARAAPSDANIVIWQQDVAAITLNTDLKAYASRNGGTTYTQITLAEVASLTTGRILTGTVDISGQSSATAMKYKIETLNTKEQKIHAVALQWS